MYDPFTEHGFYLGLPKHATQAAQGIGKAGRCLVGIPRPDDESTLMMLLLQVPQPYHRVQPQAQGRGPFGALTCPGLRLLAAQQLFDVFEGVLDAPAVGEVADHLGWLHCQIGGKEKVVFFFAHRVAADDQQHRLFGDMIPQHLSGIDQSFAGVAAFAGRHRLPMTNITCHSLRWREFSSTRSRSARCPFSWNGRQIVDHRIASHAADDMNGRKVFAGQAGVKPVGTGPKSPFRQPFASTVATSARPARFGWAPVCDASAC